MIKLNGSRFTAAMPENLKEQPEVQAIAYAVGRQIEKLCAYADGARTYAAIQSMPERVLDLLAVELRTPAYDENYSIKVKRSLIEGSMLFYTQMGTPAAVEKIIETIFGAGYVSEWWEYGGKPHYFMANLINPTATLDDMKKFKQVLGSVKRLSSWLDGITSTTTFTHTIYGGEMFSTHTVTELPMAAGQGIVTQYPVGAIADENGLLLMDEDGAILFEE